MSIDGVTGNVYVGKIPTEEAEVSGEFAIIMGWADEFRRLRVRTNADTPKDAAQAVKFGAEGIGLCRTEHMFFDPARIPAVREMIVASTTEQRKKALAKLLPMDTAAEVTVPFIVYSRTVLMSRSISMVMDSFRTIPLS